MGCYNFPFACLWDFPILLEHSKDVQCSVVVGGGCKKVVMDIWEHSWAQLRPERGQEVASVWDLSPGLGFMCSAAALCPGWAAVVCQELGQAPGKSLLLLGGEPWDAPGCWHHVKLTGTQAREHFQQGGMCKVLSCWHPFLQGSPPACPTALLNPCLPLQAMKSIPLNVDPTSLSSGLQELRGSCGRGWR